MKNKLLALLLMVALVCTALFVVACQPEEPTPEYSWPINISNFWAGHEDEETYTIVSGTGGVQVLKSLTKKPLHGNMLNVVLLTKLLNNLLKQKLWFWKAKW